MGSFFALLALISGSLAVNFPCNFDHFDKTNPPLFVTSHNKARFLAADRTIQIPHNDKVEAYCNHKFSPEKDNNGNWLTNEIVEIECSNGSVTLNDRRAEYLSCDVPSYYEYDLDYCGPDSYSYLIALNVRDIPVVLAAVCFDEAKLYTKFMKLVPTKRELRLIEQKHFNPVNIALVDIFENPIRHSSLYSGVLSDEETQRQIRTLIGIQANVVKFSESSLVPPHIFKPVLLHNNSVNTIIWWKNLRDGNWAHIYSLLHKQTNEFEIYTGSSDVARARNDHGRDVQLMLNNGTKWVPLYVWMYLKARDGRDIVIVGVNSPFVSIEGAAPVNQICQQNICDQTDWLQGRRNTLKFPAFGFVVCCEPNRLGVELEGLPKELLYQYNPNDYWYTEYQPRPRPFPSYPSNNVPNNAMSPPAVTAPKSPSYKYNYNKDSRYSF